MRIQAYTAALILCAAAILTPDKTAACTACMTGDPEFGAFCGQDGCYDGVIACAPFGRACILWGLCTCGGGGSPGTERKTQEEDLVLLDGSSGQGQGAPPLASPRSSFTRSCSGEIVARHYSNVRMDKVREKLGMLAI